ncbi:MAG: ArsR family transcriptional regulator [Actinomycetia bacterium]|nr:ArsR family transcriptional regulator [Actinomycetes bacterium]
MFEVTVIEAPAAAEASLDPMRARLLAELASATVLAARVGLTRQKVNYHLRALERHGLVELVEERRKGNVTERMTRATAASYVISPTALVNKYHDETAEQWRDHHMIVAVHPSAHHGRPDADGRNREGVLT